MKHKNEIIKLRAQGKSYLEIQKLLGCSKGTIAYHCGEGQKEKTTTRTKRNRKNNPLLLKIDSFKKKDKLSLQNRTIHFHLNRNEKYYEESSFNYLDLIIKHGIETFCYLTGKPVNLLVADTYQLDHIMPKSKGGTNTLDNCGVTCPKANQAKRDMNVSEFLELCQDVLKHHGFKIEPPETNN
jgi:5-methylcytosine-specific restriction endonuclease McrA